MSIKLKILLPVGLLSALLIMASAYRAMESWEALTVARYAASVNVTADRLYIAAAAWAVERGSTAIALADPQRPNPVIRAKRLEGNQAFEEALGAIDRLPRTPRIDVAVKQLARIGRLADEARTEVDAALRNGLASEGLRQTWIPTATALIMAGQDLRAALEATVSTGVAAPVVQAFELKAALWRAAEFAGRERATLAAVISGGKPLIVRELEVVLTARGEVEGSLARVAEAKDAFGPAFADAYGAIMRVYLDKIDPLRMALFQSSGTAQPYTVTGDEWFAAATHGIDTIFSAQRAASAAAKAVLDGTVETAFNSVLLSIATLAAVLLATTMAGWTAAAGVARPLRAMTESMRALAEGRLDTEIVGGDRHDEVGDMAAAMDVFKAQAIENAHLRAEQERERAASEAAKIAALHRMAETVERETRVAVDSVAERTHRMDANAQAMADSAGRMSSNSQAVAAAAAQALTNVQTVAAATEELTGAIREIGAQVSHATEVTKRAVEKGRGTQNTISSLSEAVAKIGDVSKLISDIASQTNLLALNATIEAARAGDAGKGFAVVANEVKHLANQTAKATEDIAAQIAAIQSVTQDAVHAVQDIGGTVLEIEAVSGAVAAAMEEQSAATSEISRNVVETAAAAQDVSCKIAEVSDEVRATGSRAGDVRNVASDVALSIEELRNVLVRVVRTSMSEVDRRHEPRHLVHAPCRVEIDGCKSTALLGDISEGGAMLKEIAAAGAGSIGILRIDGIPMALKFVVRSVGKDDQAHLAFDLEPEQRDRLSQAIHDLLRSKGARD